MPEPAPPSFFVSYSELDTAWRERLFDLSIGTTLGICKVWSDISIRAGDRWKQEIDAQLLSCQVAVLLVSPNFVKSKFIKSRELPLVLKRARAKRSQLRIIWIPINISRQEVEEQLPKLAAFQDALGLEQTLPARPEDCSIATLEQFRRNLSQQMQAAIDPFGADLTQRVAERYDVQLRLGEGQRAVVYQAYDPQLKRSVAIKALRNLSDRDSFRVDVEQALRTSEEPSFASIYDAAYGANASYCVVQHIQGKSLGAYLNEWACGESMPPDPDTLRRTFVKLLRAIVRAHHLEIPCGNLRPSNIVIDRHKEPFILPMGDCASPTHHRLAGLLTRLHDDTAAGRHTGDQDLEDLAYLLPEQLGSLDQVKDPKLADQYMLGLLAYQMSTGKPPLRVHDYQLLMREGSSAMSPLPPVTSVRRLFPQRLELMIERMTALDPGLRYPSLTSALEEPDLHDDYNLVLARDSYRRCTRSKDFDRTFFMDFYEVLQRLYPSTQVHLARIAGPDRWQRQHQMLKQAVLLLFAFAQRREDNGEPNVLTNISLTHAQISPGLFEPFMNVLVALVCGDATNDIRARDPLCRHADVAGRLRQHWLKALSPGIDYLTKAALGRDGATAAANPFNPP